MAAAAPPPFPWRTVSTSASATTDTDGNHDGGAASGFDADNVLRVLHRVQQILGHSFRFPRIVMVGDQPVQFCRNMFTRNAWRWTGFS